MIIFLLEIDFEFSIFFFVDAMYVVSTIIFNNKMSPNLRSKTVIDYLK